MKQLLRKLFEKAPSHYPPQNVSEVDWEFDARHPWRRSIRQNRAFVRASLIIVMISAAGAFLHDTLLAAVLAGTIAVLFLSIFFSEKRHDETSGHLHPGPGGEYWRALKDSGVRSATNFRKRL